MGKIKYIIKSSWRGEQPLWKVYWLYGMLTGLVLGFITGFTIGILMNTHNAVKINLISHILLLPHEIWCSISVWRCAPNCSNKFWKILARFATILGFLFYIVNIYMFIIAK